VNFLAAFLLGLAGSLHCAAMCGPLLLAVNAARRQNPVRPAERLFGGDMIQNFAYHGGRLVTYGFLGAVSGLIGAAVIFAGFQRWLSIGAGGLILLGTLTSLRLRWGGLAVRALSAARTRFGRLLHNRALGAAALLGALNGLLPCGLVYVACAAAATAGGVAGGVAAMLAFGLGTAPMTLSIGLAGKAFRWGQPLVLRRVVLGCAAAAGVLLIVRGLSLGIPYLSPGFSDGQGPTCDCHHTL
jgi:sulfite exporter TauE/SafE